MTTRGSWVPLVVLAIASPVLAFPAVLGPVNASLAAAAGILAMLGTLWLIRGYRLLPMFVGLLALTSLVGWVRSSDHPDTLNHFCGLALGLFTMGTVAAWCHTRERFALATAVFLVCGGAALVIGNRSTTPVHTTKALFKETTAAVAEVTPLPLPGLHQRTSVNRNALAAAATMILPVAAAVALTQVQPTRAMMVFRLVGLVTALWATVIIVIMQSRSAWMSALIVLWLSARRVMRLRTWWAISGVGAIVLPVLLLFVWSDHPRVVELVVAVQARVDIWKQGLQALQPSPWFGIGLDYFRYGGHSPILVWPDQIVGRPHAHNLFLQTALDVGLIGLVGYLLTVGYVLCRTVEAARLRAGDALVAQVAAGALLSLASVHVYGILDAIALGTKVGVLQWVVSGMALAAWRISGGRTGSKQAMT